MKRDATTYKKTKIVATIGPASTPYIYELLEAGVNAIRLNFSHGDYKTHKQNMEAARAASRQLNRGLAIIQDLSGPKIRLGELPEGGVQIKRGDTVGFSYGDSYDEDLGILPSQYDFTDQVNKGEHIFLRDGQVKLVIERVKGGIVTAKALNAGTILSHHGINLPDTHFQRSVLTHKDREDIAFAIREDVDYVAVSFVQTAKTIQEVRRLLKPAKHPVHIITKIETKAAVTNLEEIIAASDAVMVARGDLGVEIGAENVPIIGRRIIDLAKQAQKPVIMATQMLESMIESTQPTRAEANDVSTAVLLGVDAVMLSGETAIGKFPVETVKMMKKIILTTEQYSLTGAMVLEANMDELGAAQIALPKKTSPDLRRIHETTRIVFEQQVGYLENSNKANRIASSVALAAITLAEQIGAKFILAETLTGHTAHVISSLRPGVPIVMASPDRHVCNKLAIVWGGKPLLVPKQREVSNLVIEEFRNRGSIRKGDYIIAAFGKHHSMAGGTDTVRVLAVE